MNDYTLVLLAAGKGSRFGGLKQLHTFGEQKATLAEFAIWDAWQQGFRNFIAVVSEETQEGFQSIFKKWGLENRSKCILQEQMVPETTHFSRQKPWGTAHALYSIRKHIHTPFVIINADDFYGKNAYYYATRFLQANKKDFALVGYPIEKTLSPNGTVSRALCTLDEQHYVTCLQEYSHIKEKNGTIVGLHNEHHRVLTKKTWVSLNFWILQPTIFEPLELEWHHFLEHLTDPQKEEFYLPVAIQSIAQHLQLDIHCLLNPNGYWLGVTYAQDAAIVQETLNVFTQNKQYPLQMQQQFTKKMQQSLRFL